MTLTEENIFVTDRKRVLDLSREKSIGHVITDVLSDKHAEKVLVVDHASGRQWKGSELREKILNLATGLIKEYNFQPGTVAVLSYPCSDWFTITALGVICAGGAIVSMTADDPYDQILVVAKKVEFKFLFCVDKNKNWAEKLEMDMGYKVSTIVMDKTDGKNSLHFLMNYDRTDSMSVEVPVACRDKKKDWALIEMTSGTTGVPKASVLTHHNLMYECVTGCPFEKGDRVITNSMSVDYIVARKNILVGLYLGLKLVMLERQDVELILEATQKHRIELLFMSSFLLYNLMTFEKLYNYNIESIEVVCGFGSKLGNLDKLREFLVKHKHIRYFSIGYGTTEVGTISRDDIDSSEFLRVDHGTGRLECNTKVRIVDTATGENLGRNKQGEVRVLNPTTFPGYIDIERQRLTSASDPLIRNSTIFDDQGYYITGDIGHFNDKDELFVHGRIREVMLLKCWKITPQEIEEDLVRHPAVHSACVLPIKAKDNPLLDWPRAFVRLKSEYYTDKVQDITLPENSSSYHRQLKHQGEHRLCSIAEEKRRQIAENILEFYDSQVNRERQLTGGLVILDELKAMAHSGKVNKEYLRSLALDQIEVYGDRREL